MASREAKEMSAFLGVIIPKAPGNWASKDTGKVTSKVNLEKREAGNYFENTGSSEERAERLNLDAMSVRKADEVTPLPSTTVYVSYIYVQRKQG